MRITLINPPYRCIPNEPRHATPPLGLAFLAASLREAGHEVDILDAVVSGYTTEWLDLEGQRFYGLPVSAVAEAVASRRPELVGLSLPFAIVENVVGALASAIKDRLKDVPIVVGGAHASAVPERICRMAGIDYVIAGEGERAMVALAAQVSAQQQPQPQPGLWWHDERGVHGQPPQWLTDLDLLPPPALDLIDVEAYYAIDCMHGEVAAGLRSMPIVTSRGCPSGCVFCSIHPLWGKRYRAHSVRHVLAMIDDLVSRHGVNHLLIEDDNFSFDPDRAKAILGGLVSRHSGLTWSTPNGISIATLDDELVALIKKSGCIRLTLPVESGDQETLSTIIGKPLQLSKVVEVARSCRRHGLQTSAFFVIGLPGETRAAIERSLSFASRLEVDSLNIMFATPLPGTPLQAICEEQRLLKPDFSANGLTTQNGQIRTSEFDAALLHRLARRALTAHALRNPRGACRRVAAKARVSPAATFAFMWRRMIGPA